MLLWLKESGFLNRIEVPSQNNKRFFSKEHVVFCNISLDEGFRIVVATEAVF